MSTAETQHHDEGTFFWRFSVLHRLFHLVVLVSFTLLALTGLPLKFSGCPLSYWVLFIFGGVDGAAAVHRFMGIVTFGYVILHIVWLCYYKIVLKGSLFGPQAMMPRLKDFQDLIQNIKYFLGQGTPPKFERFTYWEKFDYLAVFWGVPVIGLSGLVVWFPEFFSRFMPGEFLNMAYVIHSDEAIMAVGFIFVVHMFNTHLRPEAFPITTTIFNGKISEEEMKRDHRIEWERVTGYVEPMPKAPEKTAEPAPEPVEAEKKEEKPAAEPAQKEEQPASKAEPKEDPAPAGEKKTDEDSPEKA